MPASYLNLDTGVVMFGGKKNLSFVARTYCQAGIIYCTAGGLAAVPPVTLRFR